MKVQIEFTHAPIVVPAQNFSSRAIGACLEFSGLVRELEHGKIIPGLHYEAHEPMARTQLKKILRELGAKHPCDEVLFIHRLGFVRVGEASLFVRICAGHRQASLALMAELIDQLKTDVPVWKNPAT